MAECDFLSSHGKIETTSHRLTAMGATGSVITARKVCFIHVDMKDPMDQAVNSLEPKVL